MNKAYKLNQSYLKDKNEVFDPGAHWTLCDWS